MDRKENIRKIRKHFEWNENEVLHQNLWDTPKAMLGWRVFFFVFFCFFFCLFAFSRATPAEYGGSQARGLIRAVAAGLHHSHSSAGSKPCLRPTSQLMTTPDP